MGREEQVEEREVLQSIFADELTDSQLSLEIPLDIVYESGDLYSGSSITLLLQVTCPAEYPDIAPDLDIVFPHEAEKIPLLELPEDKEPLLASAQSIIEESLGMAMIFSIHSTLKEAAEDLVRTRQQELRDQRDRKIAEEEAKENAKFQGQVVTKESFLEWRDTFRKEMADAEDERKRLEELERGKRGVKDEKKLTGKELWENGLIGKDEDDLPEDDVLESGVESLKVE